MYEVFVRLLEKYGVTAYKVSKATGIAGSTFTDWKNGRSTPKQDKLQRIADYFGVGIHYLMTGEEDSAVKDTPMSPKNDRDIEKKLSELLELLEHGSGLMFGSRNMDDDIKQLLEIGLRSTLESARIAARKPVYVK